jgi:hypothetical protein
MRKREKALVERDVKRRHSGYNATVGSAYGDSGVWSRWGCYIGTGYGWNDELTQLINREGLDYARRNFRISLLEYCPAKTDDKVLLERKSCWKEALLSRGLLGYNKN